MYLALNTSLIILIQRFLVERFCKHLQLIIRQIVDNIGNQTPKHQVIVSKKSGALLIVPSTLTLFNFFVQKLLDESNFADSANSELRKY